MGPKIPVPAYGVGTALFKKEKGEINRTIVDSVKNALAAGFIHIDCAEVYGNEEEVGVALKEANVPRSKLFITSKVMHNVDNIPEALNESLRKLGTDYLDLYLLHSPIPFYEKKIPISEGWKAMETALGTGLVHSVGVSNFRIPDLEELLKTSTITPRVNQIEFHPQVYKAAKPLVEFCQSKGIIVEGYGPLSPLVRDAQGPVAEFTKSLESKYHVSDTQILLKWAYSKGVIPITTTSKIERMKECLNFDSFTLDKADIDELGTLGVQHHKRTFMKHMDE